MQSLKLMFYIAAMFCVTCVTGTSHPEEIDCITNGYSVQLYISYNCVARNKLTSSLSAWLSKQCLFCCRCSPSDTLTTSWQHDFSDAVGSRVLGTENSFGTRTLVCITTQGSLVDACRVDDGFWTHICKHDHSLEITSSTSTILIVTYIMLSPLRNCAQLYCQSGLYVTTLHVHQLEVTICCNSRSTIGPLSIKPVNKPSNGKAKILLLGSYHIYIPPKFCAIQQFLTCVYLHI